jgi:hypothetical protein
MIRPGAQFGFCLVVVFGLFDPLVAPFTQSCGPGCHTTPSGACVRDGWQQALPVRNECPAFTSPRPPCGAYYRWDRRMRACFPT